MYIVIELQANIEGQVANIVTAYETLAQAQNKYYTILAAATISSIPIHSAAILDHCGNLIANQSFSHPVEVKPEETKNQ